jgi:hypothetical protein
MSKKEEDIKKFKEAEKAAAEAKAAEKPEAFVPQFKVFRFHAVTPVNHMEKEMNDWLIDKTMSGEKPMPGKAFSNHATGEIIVACVHMVKMEVPEKYLTKP